MHLNYLPLITDSEQFLHVLAVTSIKRSTLTSRTFSAPGGCGACAIATPIRVTDLKDLILVALK